MTADVRIVDDKLVLEGPVRIQSRALTNGNPNSLNIEVDDNAVTITGPLHARAGAQIVGLESTKLSTDELFIVGEELAGLPALPAVTAETPSSPSPSPKPSLRRPGSIRDIAGLRQPISIRGSGQTTTGQKWARDTGLVTNHTLDLVEYVRTLHAHIAALYKRIETLES
ncbi:hypothetical protein DB30_03048 [Enhygromyxa salina]|uniref:Uncharacterized protein n=1 Tax=Enhygromyxa salina TaxID=215803 RepID=A0A0C2DCX2_9BACT|nr:hypothetical protein [Enhygromyxa salina]KIG17567.1 hypothetical protein DB30_03048 [Enhygromyxa salina]